MGFIVTFYSYKGGVGRTMAMSNIAVLLARQGLKVLAVDWDLEAPGLDYYFKSLSPSTPEKKQTGLLGFLLDSIDLRINTTPIIWLLIQKYNCMAGILFLKLLEKKVNWQDYLSEINVGSKHKLKFLDSGVEQDKKNINKVLSFDWAKWYEYQGGGVFIESLREEWRANFDIILVDSRSGLTDIGGICTIHLPDILVIVFKCTYQSLFGAKDVALTAKQEISMLDFDRLGLTVLPLPSLIDVRPEYKEKETKKWLKTFADELEVFYDDWTNKNTKPIDIIERTKLPYVPYFSFGETLPVLKENNLEPNSLESAYLNVAQLLKNEFSEEAVHNLFNTSHTNHNKTKYSSLNSFWVCIGTPDKPHKRVENPYSLNNCKTCGRARTDDDEIKLEVVPPQNYWTCYGLPSLEHPPCRNNTPICRICGSKQHQENDEQSQESNEKLKNLAENIKIAILLFSTIIFSILIVAYLSKVSTKKSTNNSDKVLYKTALQYAKQGDITRAVEKLCKISDSSEEFTVTSSLVRKWFKDPKLRPHIESYLEVLNLQSKNCPVSKNLPR